MKLPPPKEKDIQAAILHYLKCRHDVFAWRQNTGAVKYEDGRFVKFGFAGVSDILGVLKGGRMLAIEVKAPGKKQTDNQVSFQRMVEEMGGLYVLAYSLNDVVNALKSV